MKRGLLVLGAVVVVAPLLLAQRPAGDARLPMGRPEDVGMSSPRLARLTTAMQAYINRREVAGVVTLVARQGRVVHLESLGRRSVEDATPMTTDTMFRLASMTKPIVSAAAMMLYEEGAFQLSDAVSKYGSRSSAACSSSTSRDPVAHIPSRTRARRSRFATS